LGNLYNVEAFDSAELALPELRKSKNTSIVITGNILKRMNGDALLQEVRKIDPDIIRIIMTSSDDSRDIVNMLKSSDAHLYIKKPFNSLEFLQIIRNMNNLYNKSIEAKKYYKKAKKLKTEVDQLDTQIKKYSELTTDEFQSIIKSMSKMINGSERFYFKTHTNNLSQVAKKLAIRLNLTEERQKQVIYTSFIANHYLIGLPDKYRLIDPRDLDDQNEKEMFNKHFKESISNLLQIPSIKKYVKYTAMLFENVDGSGQPMGITGIDIPKEMQIIGIVNLYFNLVYRLREQDLFKLKMEGVIYQSKSETFQRHREAITYLYKRIKWFDHDLFYKFQEMVKKREVTELKFNEKDLVIEYNKDEYITPVRSDGRMDEYVSFKTFDERKQVRVVDENLELKEEFIEVKLRLVDLEMGMILSRPIVNYSGATVIKAKSELDQKMLDTIIKYYDLESIPDKAYIKKTKSVEKETEN
jgi:response regulator RpfG family c-di-GMP phosphodiesterase